MNDRTFDQLLAAWIEHGPTVAPDRVSVEARREIRRTRQSSALGPWLARRFADMSTFAKVGVAAAIVIVVTLVSLSILSGRPPANPGPTPSSTWSGPVRTDLGGAVVAHTSEADGSASWTDPGDAAMGWVDITHVLFADVNAGHWNIALGSWPPPATGPDGGDLIVAHGLVLDTTGDGVADYVVGVDDGAPRPGDFRAWATNLATGVTSEQIGPPYGVPIEFGHYAEEDFQGPGLQGPFVGLTFLDGTEPADFDIETLRYYVWASATEGEEVVAWDYAPDAAWLGFASASPSAVPIESAGESPEWVLRFPGTRVSPAGVYGSVVAPPAGERAFSRGMHNVVEMGTDFRQTQLTFATADDCFAGAEGPEPVPARIAGLDGLYVEPYADPAVQFVFLPERETRTGAYALPVGDQTLCVYLSWDADTTAEELDAARQVVESLRARRYRQTSGIQIEFTLPEGWDTG